MRWCAAGTTWQWRRELALVSGSSTMYDNATACDNAILTGGCIRNEAIVCGNARVRENAATHIAPVVTGQSVIMGDLSGSVVVYGRGFILPGQTVDNPTRRLIGLNERGAAIVREPSFAPGRDGKNRNTHPNDNREEDAFDPNTRNQYCIWPAAQV